MATLSQDYNLKSKEVRELTARCQSLQREVEARSEREQAYRSDLKRLQLDKDDLTRRIYDLQKSQEDEIRRLKIENQDLLTAGFASGRADRQMSMQALTDVTIESMRKQLLETTSRGKELDKLYIELQKDYAALKQAYTEVKVRLTDLACKQNAQGQQVNEATLKEKYDGLKYRHKVSVPCTLSIFPPVYKDCSGGGK